MQEMCLEKAGPMFPEIKADKDFCTKCGMCEKVCPVKAMKCSPYPEAGGNCIFCFNCVQLCEEDAFKIDLSPFGEKLRIMAKENNEQPLSKIFV